MEKKKILAGALGLVVLTGGVFAYFTDVEEKENVFTIGSVNIDLIEEKWDEEEPDHDPLVPGESIAKDPKVENTGVNDAYVYLEITVPMATVVTVDDSGALQEAALQELFTFEINENWTLLETSETETTKTYVYGYDTKLASGEETNTLFDEVTLINIIEGQDIETTQVINVVARAIQSDETESMQDAYTKIHAE